MNTQITTPVQRLIGQYEAQTSLVFKPSRKFYELTAINRIRFAKLTKGELSPTVKEANSLANYFNQFFPTELSAFSN